MHAPTTRPFASRSPPVQADDLLQLDDRRFENLVFDLLAARGVQNLQWRTPGRDGGRDIQGHVTTMDFSGEVRSELWYCECKRYATSIPWPVVFEKVSYASNANADFLLLVSSSTLSPQCIDEVASWNSARRKPTVRHWPGHFLVQLLHSHPSLMLKYGLGEPSQHIPLAVFALSQEVAKAVQATEAAKVFDEPFERYLAVAATLSDLMTSRLLDFETLGRISPQLFRPQTDSFDWVTCTGPIAMDRLGGRALLSIVRLAPDIDDLSVRATQNGNTIVSSNKPIQVPSTLWPLVAEVSQWSDFEVTPDDRSLLVTQREAPDV